MHYPKISIITINLNNKTGIEKTIQSVISQTHGNVEYIIIDGGSNDSSIDVIRKYADKINYWISEPDKGVYNAMNKGIAKATGEYCLFLNSGDWLADENVIRDFNDVGFKEDVVSGNTYLVSGNNIELRKAVDNEFLTYDFFLKSILIHQSTFIKRDSFRIYGLYNENFKIVSDWEFFIKVLIVNNCSYQNFNRIISCFNLDGISHQKNWVEIQSIEREEVLQNQIPRVYKFYQKICHQNDYLISHEKDYQEYMSLKQGKFSVFIKLFLFIKRKLKKI